MTEWLNWTLCASHVSEMWMSTIFDLLETSHHFPWLHVSGSVSIWSFFFFFLLNATIWLSSYILVFQISVFGQLDPMLVSHHYTVFLKLQWPVAFTVNDFTESCHSLETRWGMRSGSSTDTWSSFQCQEILSSWKIIRVSRCIVISF